MSSSADFYNQDTATRRELFLHNGTPKNDSTKWFLELAAASIADDKTVRVLDLGTGNGFVPLMLATKYAKQAAITGVDLAPEMVAMAKEQTKDIAGVTIMQCDNYNLPFPAATFDLVTNKLSTHFSIAEVYRVLKPGGSFVFKEYGLGKGILEIARLFKGRVVSVDPLTYMKQLRESGFNSYSYQQCSFTANHTLREVGNILASAPIIQNYDERRDIATIQAALGLTNISLTSDPFIIHGKK